ncbi:MAG: hypothetical protein K2O16_04775 [Lachnospiraceae bacterium]|nr:hypothetical protein [Lachnospiraceae bacterium]
MIRNRNKKVMAGNLIITGIAFALILVLNFHTDYTADDFKYRFFFDTIGTPLETSHPMKAQEVFGSMVNHWKMWNGRVVAHGMLQLALIFGKTGFKILNSFMFIFLGTLIYAHASHGRKKSVSLLLFVYICLWFFLPQFGMTILWASGAASYLWCGVLILAFSLPYRMHLTKQKTGTDGWRSTALMGLFGVLAGCTNENSGGALVFLCGMYVALYLYKKIPVPKWAYGGIAGGIAGAVLLISSPGNYRISSKTDIYGLMERWKYVVQISKNQWAVLLLVLCVMFLFSAAFGKQAEEEFRRLPLIYFLAGCASVCVLVFSAMQPERAWFIGTVFLIITAACVYGEVLDFSWTGRAVLNVLLILFFAWSFLTEFQKIAGTYRQVAEGVRRIEQAVEEGSSFAVIPMVYPSDSKYDPYNGTGYVKESPDDWMNAWMARFYGLDKIYGE